jgi:hypothetical protein
MAAVRNQRQRSGWHWEMLNPEPVLNRFTDSQLASPSCLHLAYLAYLAYLAFAFEEKTAISLSHDLIHCLTEAPPIDNSIVFIGP